MPIEGAQTTPDLDQIMLEGHPVFDGSQSAVPGGAGEPGPAEEKPAAAEVAGEPAAARDEDTEGSRTPAGEFRFTSHEEAERGYRELQGRATRAEQNNKDLERQLQEVRGAETRKRQQEEEAQAFIDFATTRREQALLEIDELDPDAPDYKKRVAGAWAKADQDMRTFAPERGEAAPAPARPAASAPLPATDDPAAIRTYAQGVIEQEGLAGDDPLFWSYAGVTPDRDGQGNAMPLDQQIRWALEQTKNYRERIETEVRQKLTDQAQERGEEAQRRSMPMGRAGVGGRPAAKEETRPFSLGDAVDHALEMRRL